MNNAPDRLQIARQNSDGTPEFHGWPDRFGFLDSTQSVFNPIGGGGDDLFPDIARIKAENTPVRHVLALRRSGSSPRTSPRWGSISRRSRSWAAW